MNDITRKVIDKLEASPAHAVAAAAYNLGLLRITLQPDESYSFEDLCGDCYNPTANDNIPAEQLKKEKQAYRRRVNREGVWGAVLEVRRSPIGEWQDPEVTHKQVWSEHYQTFCTVASGTDSIWGFVGEDFIGSGYEQQMIETGVEWLSKGEYTPGQLALEVDRLNNALQAYDAQQVTDLAIQQRAQEPELPLSLPEGYELDDVVGGCVWKNVALDVGSVRFDTYEEAARAAWWHHSERTQGADK